MSCKDLLETLQEKTAGKKIKCRLNIHNVDYPVLKVVTLPRAPAGEEFSQPGQLWWGVVRRWGLRHGGE